MKLNVKKIESERERLRLSRAAFSRMLGMVPSAYGKMVKEESTKLTTIARIASILHVDARDLITR